MKPSTSGEKLFLLIKNEILPAIKAGGLTWSRVDELFSASCGGEEFSSYIKGATTIYNMKRLLVFWRHERPQITNQNVYISSIATFVGNSIFPGLDLETRKKIARYVINAELSSFRKIPDDIRKKYKSSAKKASCYLCDTPLDTTQTDDKAKDFFTLEHLWPTSMGGDSDEDNLLPACILCQDLKKNFLSWEWLNIQNSIYSIAPSGEELKSIPWETRIAKHYLAAIKLAESQNIKLKESFQKIGPISTPISFVPTSEPLTFFDLKTT